MNIDETLADRGKRYGEFDDHATVTQEIKRTLQAHVNWDCLEDDQKEALEMIAHKIGRIINGDPNYVDSWTDIIGYARLVEKRLLDEQEAQKDSPCDSPACPACNPELSAALDVLLKSGVVTLRK